MRSYRNMCRYTVNITKQPPLLKRAKGLLRFCLIWACFSPLYCGGSLSAQEVIKQGLLAKDVEAALGPPQQRVEGKDGQETWVYGKSKLFINQSRVVALFDEGELKRLSELSFKKEPEKSEEPLFPSWPNPWTTPSNQPQQDIVDKLIE